MRKWILSLCVLFCCLAFCQESQARWRLFGRRYSGNSYSSQSSVQLTGSDQQKCQQKAQLMANQRRMSHGVARLVGGYEGIGMGGSRNCSTCTPRGGMKLTGDGAAQSSNGTWYRCRSWR